MKNPPVMLLSVALVMGVALLLGAQAQKPKQQWEYARLNLDSQKDNWSWTAPTVAIEGKDVQELCKKLSIPEASNNDRVHSIVNWAGSQGWEMTVLVRESWVSVAWFKRPK